MNNENKKSNPGALDGVRVIDATHLVPGGWCAMMLGDLGADVVRVESPGAAARVSFLQCVNRNKRSMTLNLKTDQGRGIFKQLARDADVIIEDMRPGLMRGLGLDYETLCMDNPKLVFCSLTGFGHTGPYSGRPAHEINFYGMSGLMSMNRGRDGAPVIPGAQAAAIGGGGLPASAAILAALLSRANSGRGQFIDMALFDGTVNLMLLQAAAALAAGGPADTPLTGKFACYNVYKTADDQWITVGALEPPFWKTFCEKLEIAHLIPKQYDPSIIPEVETKVKEKTLAQIMSLFEESPACVEPVVELYEVFTNDPQVKARGMAAEIPAPEGRSINLPGNPINLTQTPWQIKRPIPSFGQHTTEILNELGLPESEIEDMKKNGIV